MPVTITPVLASPLTPTSAAAKPETRLTLEAHEPKADDSDRPLRLSSYLTASAARGVILNGLESLQVGPTFYLRRQTRTETGRGAETGEHASGPGLTLSITPGVRLPDRILGYHDVWTHRMTPDLIFEGQRWAGQADSLEATAAAQTRRTALLGAVTWTHTLRDAADLYLSGTSRDPSSQTARSPYRSLAVGSDIWLAPRRVPFCLEMGVRALPSSPHLYFGLGYSPRRHSAKPERADDTANREGDPCGQFNAESGKE